MALHSSMHDGGRRWPRIRLILHVARGKLIAKVGNTGGAEFAIVTFGSVKKKFLFKQSRNSYFFKSNEHFDFFLRLHTEIRLSTHCAGNWFADHNE